MRYFRRTFINPVEVRKFSILSYVYGCSGKVYVRIKTNEMLNTLKFSKF